MEEDGFDPCECIWNHEMAMRRLLSILRQGQSYCTDNECADELPGLTGPQTAGGNNGGLFLMMMCWVLLAVVLYLMRPGSLRRSALDSKSNNDNSGQHDHPPPGPALM
ncbi:small integral membrane protein 14 [Neocloeon triangulifer]|uniref:small integral membrane protein 14 n=1 Tax=Neocloeon triangulifer TaxID=2078957 RepID=UPI00286EEFDD|nr:small integral membrane protein 14 [Neocloeon triangulifer]